MNQQYKKTEKDLSFGSLLTNYFYFLSDSSAYLPEKPNTYNSNLGSEDSIEFFKNSNKNSLDGCTTVQKNINSSG